MYKIYKNNKLVKMVNSLTEARQIVGLNESEVSKLFTYGIVKSNGYEVISYSNNRLI